MKTDYDLLPGETVLAQAERVSRYITERKTTGGGTFILTDKRIIWIVKGTFGKIKEQISFPLNDIGIYDNKANVQIKESFGEPAVMTINFKSSLEKFRFWDSDKKTSKIIANHINRIVTGVDIELFSSRRSIPGSDILADTLKGTFDTFKENFVGKKKVVQITIKCPACGASFVGYKGQVAQCPYCGNMQNV